MRLNEKELPYQPKDSKTSVRASKAVLEPMWLKWEEWRRNPESRPKPEPWVEEFVKETYRVWNALGKATKDIWK